jgi:hypothetical protein
MCQLRRRSSLRSSRLSAQDACVLLASGDIGEAARQTSIRPSLQDGRHAKPPDRELQNENLGARELLLHGDDVRREGSRFAGGRLLSRYAQEFRVGPLAMKVVDPFRSVAPEAAVQEFRMRRQPVEAFLAGLRAKPTTLLERFMSSNVIDGVTSGAAES